MRPVPARMGSAHGLAVAAHWADACHSLVLPPSVLMLAPSAASGNVAAHPCSRILPLTSRLVGGPIIGRTGHPHGSGSEPGMNHEPLARDRRSPRFAVARPYAMSLRRV